MDLAFLIIGIIMMIVSIVIALHIRGKKNREVDNLGVICTLYQQGRIEALAELKNLKFNERLLISILLDKHFDSEKKAKARRLFAPALSGIIDQIDIFITTMDESRAQLAGQEKYDDRTKSLLEGILAKMDRLDDNILALQEIHTFDAENIAVTPDAYEADTLLRLVADKYTPKAEAKGLALEITLAEDISIYADIELAAQALGQVVDNALKFTPAGGKVTVTTMRHESSCRIDVSDTGPGIAMEELNSVFVKFWRSPSVKGTEGLGIGLYLAKLQLSAQNGNIRVTSLNGNGATFSVFLPLGQSGAT